MRNTRRIYERGIADPISLTILGALLVSFIAGSVAVVRNGNFDIRERAQTYPCSQGVSSCLGKTPGSSCGTGGTCVESGGVCTCNLPPASPQPTPAVRYRCASDGSCVQNTSGEYLSISECSANCQPQASPIQYCSGSGVYSCNGNVSKYCINPNIPTSDTTCSGSEVCVADNRRCIPITTQCQGKTGFTCSGKTSRYCATETSQPQEITCAQDQNCVASSQRCETIPNYCGTNIGYFCDGNVSRHCAQAYTSADLRDCTGEDATCVANAQRCVSNQTACQSKPTYSCEGQNSIYCPSSTQEPRTKTCESYEQCVTDSRRCVAQLSCPGRCTNGCFSTDNNGDGYLDCRAYCKTECAPYGGCSSIDSQGGVCNVVEDAPPTITFFVNPSTIESNGSTTLYWNTTNATSCSAGGGWSGGKSTSGNQTISNLTSSTSFSLSCTGPGGDNSVSAGVTVNNASENLCGNLPRYQCDGNTVLYCANSTSKQQRINCTTNQICVENEGCLAKKSAGQTCSNDSQCQTNYCRNNVCTIIAGCYVGSYFAGGPDKSCDSCPYTDPNTGLKYKNFVDGVFIDTAECVSAPPVAITPPPVTGKPNGETCRTSGECLSGYCGKDPRDNTFACGNRPQPAPVTVTCTQDQVFVNDVCVSNNLDDITAEISPEESAYEIAARELYECAGNYSRTGQIIGTTSEGRSCSEVLGDVDLSDQVVNGCLIGIASSTNPNSVIQTLQSSTTCATALAATLPQEPEQSPEEFIASCLVEYRGTGTSTRGACYQVINQYTLATFNQQIEDYIRNNPQYIEAALNGECPTGDAICNYLVTSLQVYASGNTNPISYGGAATPLGLQAGALAAGTAAGLNIAPAALAVAGTGLTYTYINGQYYLVQISNALASQPIVQNLINSPVLNSQAAGYLTGAALGTAYAYGSYSTGIPFNAFCEFGCPGIGVSATSQNEYITMYTDELGNQYVGFTGLVNGQQTSAYLLPTRENSQLARNVYNSIPSGASQDFVESYLTQAVHSLLPYDPAAVPGFQAADAYGTFDDLALAIYRGQCSGVSCRHVAPTLTSLLNDYLQTDEYVTAFLPGHVTTFNPYTGLFLQPDAGYTPVSFSYITGRSGSLYPESSIGIRIPTENPIIIREQINQTFAASAPVNPNQARALPAITPTSITLEGLRQTNPGLYELFRLALER